MKLLKRQAIQSISVVNRHRVVGLSIALLSAGLSTLGLSEERQVEQGRDQLVLLTSQPTDAAPSAASGDVDEKTKLERVRIFKEMLDNSTLIGKFTVDGKPTSELTEDRYTIKSVEPLPDDPQLWTIETRIQYKDHDVTLPLILKVMWSDKTPMIVLDRAIMPGLGTFSARVLFDDGKYAGTWSHIKTNGNVGGHLFGKIEKN